MQQRQLGTFLFRLPTLEQLRQPAMRRTQLLLYLTGYLVHQAASFEGPFLRPGEVLNCAKWFPEDPCFWRATYLTSLCSRTYEWKMNKRAIEDVSTERHLPTTNFLDQATIEDAQLLLDNTLAMMEETQSNNGTDTPTVSTALTQNLDNMVETVSFAKSADPPCCQWSMPCFNFVYSLPSGYKLKDDRTNYNKFLCCLNSWAMSCGWHVPDFPGTIREPPQCTMPKGHPWAK